MPTSIYLIAETRTAHGVGPVKIGIANSVASRLRSLQTGNPRPLRVLGVVASYADRLAALTQEAELHERFAADRLEGEWFKPSPAVLEFARTSFVSEAESLASLSPEMGRGLPAGLSLDWMSPFAEFDEIAPCPKCNQHPKLLNVDVDGRTLHYVRCTACARSGPTQAPRGAAVEMWNDGYAVAWGGPAAITEAPTAETPEAAALRRGHLELFRSLPAEFSTHEAIAVGVGFGMSTPTVERALRAMRHAGVFQPQLVKGQHAKAARIPEAP